MLTRRVPPLQVRGFSLVEMMISLVLGLIVVGSALVLVVSVVRANGETIKATQLTAELRAAMGLVTKEVQRARLMKDPLSNVGNAVGANNPNDVIADDACLRFSYYDPDPNRDGSIADESNRAVSIGRVVIGGIGAVVAQVDFDDVSLPPAVGIDTVLPACPDAADIRLSSPELDVTRFCALVLDDGVDNAATQPSAPLCNVPATPEIAEGEWSLIRIDMSGRMVGDTSGLAITRTVSESLRVGPSRLRNPAPPPVPVP